MTTAAPAATAVPGPVRPPSKIVTVWALIGAIGVAVIVVTLVRWVTSSDFEPTDTGDDSFDGWRMVSAQVIQYGLFVTAGFWVVTRLAMPVLRDRRLTFDGKLVIAGILGGFIEPLGSYFHIALLYNASLPNMGSWAQFMPGWNTPNADHFVQPPIFILGAYIWWIAGFAFVAGIFLEWLGDRFPSKSNLWLFTVLFGLAFVFALVFEAWVVQSEIYVYPAIPDGFALWEGTTHQYSLWTPLFGAVLLTGLAALRHFRSADDESFADRGTGELRLPCWGRQAVSALAIIGFSHLWVVGAWMVPFNLVIAEHPDSTAEIPSYLRDEMCGDDTGHPCPGDPITIRGPA